MNILYIDTDLNFSTIYVNKLITETLNNLKITKIERSKLQNLMENSIYIYRLPKPNEILNLLDNELENLLNIEKNNGLNVIKFI
jgi:hypothetical protein